MEDIIRRQYEYFMVVANNVASVQETITSLKEDYLASSRRHDLDAVDPFAQADARERAEDERKRRAAAAVQAVGLLGAPKQGEMANGTNPVVPSGAPTTATPSTVGAIGPLTPAATKPGGAALGFGIQPNGVGTSGFGGGASATPSVGGAFGSSLGAFGAPKKF